MAQVFFYPNPLISISAIGNNGLPIPATSIQVGAEDPSGDLQPLQVDASGNLKVDITSASGSPIDVDVVSSVLPTGAATEAKQDAGNASLASIDTKLTAPLSVTGPLTDAELRATPVDVDTGLLQGLTDAELRAAPIDVDTGLLQGLTDAELRATPVPISGTVSTNGLTDAELRASPVDVDTGLVQGLTDTQLRATPVPVSGTVSTGGLTDAELRASPVPVSGTVTASNPSVSATGAAVPASATMVGGSDGTDLRAIKVSATGVISVDGSAVTQPISAASLPLPTGAATAANQATEIASLASIDSKLTSPLAVTGPLTDTELRASAVPVSMASAPLPTGAATAANQATEIASLASIDGKLANNYGAATGALRAAAQIGNASGVADFGSGVTTAQTIRVVPATDAAAPASAGRAKANAPTINDYSSTPVTSAAYVQLIASTTSATNLVEIFDSSGQTLFLAVGAAASEVNQLIIVPGGNGQVPLAIPAGSRISIKATGTSATVGVIVLNLYT